MINKKNQKKYDMATLGLLSQKVPIFTKKNTFTLLSRVNLKSDLKINTCIVFIGSKIWEMKYQSLF